MASSSACRVAWGVLAASSGHDLEIESSSGEKQGTVHGYSCLRTASLCSCASTTQGNDHSRLARTHIPPLVCPVARTRNRLSVAHKHAADGHLFVIQSLLRLCSEQHVS